MKTLVLNTDTLPRVLHAKRVFWVERGAVKTKVVMIAEPHPLGALVEVDDGTSEADIREAIQAATLADDWKLAYEIITRYGIAACLRCAADVADRPTWQLFWIEGVRNPLPERQAKRKNESWGQVCGTCAIWMMANHE